MKSEVFVLFTCGLLIDFCFLVQGAENESISNSSTSAQIAQGEKQLGDQIRAILKHYQQADPIGLPGAPVPDPMSVPDMKHSFSMFTMNLNSIKVYGLSKFRIEHIRSELALMQVSVALHIESLDIRGLYTLSSWLSSSAGDFTVKLTGVNIQGLARLEVGNDGKLHAQDIDMDLTFDNIDMDFQNLGFLASVFQSFINSVGSFIFDSIKPYILKEVNTNIRGEVNKHISQLPNYFPNSISPFDMAVAEARKQVSDMGYDPFKVKDYSQSMGIFTVTSSHTWLTGLASFYRMGNITLSMENGIVYAVMDIGTQEIEGRTHWEVSVIGGVLSKAGTVSFTVEYFRVQLNLSQPLDTRKRATLEELDFELGNIQTRIHGAGTIDYLVEAGINILPNLLRNQIMDALEGPIMRRIQDELDKVDVEKLIHEKIPDIEEHARMLQGIETVDDVILEDVNATPGELENQEPFSDSEEERGQS
ncbi:PREDICTED: uncharacterized protein LOC105365056 [Ceratosolen solmsi marchali]|uniref:Uncharacterized protein LOC105365056 n=1 Tax=Ceratosolen solmsi marchali TaxID=326594 RepID=A0AAJ6YNR1_9HYME|nr:PREDICTED: uncharacterized protein LOC105365056 [Ceratosolen solmsi marchali]XP_011501438.1 PREDICTED: uncharacterized protein LOC105365056 [Ceratosolen solmsi marchali]